jgi:serine/threonine protein phosphatase PrpC
MVAALLDHATEQGVLFTDLPAASLLLRDVALYVDAVDLAELQDAAHRPAILARHHRYIPQLFQSLTREQSYPAPLAAALAELQIAPAVPAQSAVARLQAALGVNPSTPQRPLSLAAGRLTDLGLVRQINEDSLVVLEFDRVYNSENTPLRLYAVADGMGGHAAGEVASKLALEKLTTALLSSARAADPLATLKLAGQEAARAVYEEARRTRSDMGTTLVAALVDVAGRKLYAINVGDSRLYKMNTGAIRRVTKDHSLVQRLIDSNQLTPEEACHHPNANLIYRTLGERAAVEIDAFEEAIDAGDKLLLCSDGLCGLVDDPDLHCAINAAPTPQAACVRLIELAKAAGGHDNITAIVVAVLDAAAPPQEPSK